MPKESYVVVRQIILVFWWLVQCSIHLLCCVKLIQLCQTLCDPMGCSLPGSSVHGFLHARNWSGLPCSPPRDLLDPGIESVSLMSLAMAGELFTTSASSLNDKTSLKSSTVIINTLTCCCYFLSLFIPTGFYFYFIIVVLAVLGLHCYAWAFSSCSGWAFHCHSFSLHGAWTLGPQVSVAMAFRCWSTTCGIFQIQE